jgi:hypothetical protein
MMVWGSWHWKQPLLEMAEPLRGLKAAQAAFVDRFEAQPS